MKVRPEVSFGAFPEVFSGNASRRSFWKFLPEFSLKISFEVLAFFPGASFGDSSKKKPLRILPRVSLGDFNGSSYGEFFPRFFLWEFLQVFLMGISMEVNYGRGVPSEDFNGSFCKEFHQEFPSASPSGNTSKHYSKSILSGVSSRVKIRKFL